MLVSARGLGRSYRTARGPIVAVEGVDLDIAAGEFVAICGRSGSGKSTLLGMIGGLCRPTSGTVSIDGAELPGLGTSALADFRARRIGFIFQFAGLLPNLRTIDNVALPALLAGEPEAAANARAHGLLGQVGLADRWDAYPGELSGGQQRRVAVARALINRPDLLLADEPTNDLDEEAENEVLGLLAELHRTRATTLIVVTHDPALARRADRVVTLRSGRLASTRTPEFRSSLEERTHDTLVPAARLEGASDDEPLVADSPFEPGPATLGSAEPSPLGAGFSRFLVGFAGWVAVVVVGLYLLDTLSARYQGQVIERRVVRRKTSEKLAMQQLRADVNDVVDRADGSYEVSLYLQNFAPERPVFVLGPEVRAFVQIDRVWQPVRIARAGDDGGRVREVRGDRRLVRFTLRIDVDHYDELIRGYFHIRITSVMVVSETAEPTEDLFERTDDYYLYLKPRDLSEDEIRARNKWAPGAIVPRWIPMPAH